MRDASAKNLCAMLVQRNLMHDASAKNLCAMLVQRNLMHDANAKDYELTESSLDSLGYRLEKRTPDIIIDVVRAVRATSPKEKKDSLSSSEEASERPGLCEIKGAKFQEHVREEGGMPSC